MSVAEIELAFEALDRELGRRGILGKVFVVEGAVLCLAFQARTATKDVDAWFAPATEIREAAAAVAASLDLPEDWLNDGAKAFLPQSPVFERWKSWENLEVSVADARTLLAMKCAASRTAEDTADIRFLAGVLGLRTTEEILKIVLSFYPAERLPVRTRLLLEEVFGEGD
ncbi:MAG TPA: hypothetical protein VE129_09450 [Thermoanaerobaculia bacterium]|nr:hypothetical protein [Thermoanaerobaculia bacterium]